MNVQDAAIKILKDVGKPHHVKEIAERIIEKVNQRKIQRAYTASCENDKAKDYKNAINFGH